MQGMSGFPLFAGTVGGNEMEPLLSCCVLLQVNAYEVPETALIRELREELCIEVRIFRALTGQKPCLRLSISESFMWQCPVTAGIRSKACVEQQGPAVVP